MTVLMVLMKTSRTGTRAMILSTLTQRAVLAVDSRPTPTRVSSAESPTFLVRSATATNPTPQAIAANAQTRPRLEEVSGYITEVSPRRAGSRPATHTVSLQPSGRRLANRPTPITLKPNAAMKP